MIIFFFFFLPIKDIIGKEWNITKEGKGPCKNLTVWVPKKTGFTEFVKVNQKSEVEGGFSIAIFWSKLPFSPLRFGHICHFSPK
ncbi:hypothetical protein Hanom_Chr09g00779361 [Helianthus anomalus]